MAKNRKIFELEANLHSCRALKRVTKHELPLNLPAQGIALAFANGLLWTVSDDYCLCAVDPDTGAEKSEEYPQLQ